MCPSRFTWWARNPSMTLVFTQHSKQPWEGTVGVTALARKRPSALARPLSLESLSCHKKRLKAGAALVSAFSMVGGCARQLDPEWFPKVGERKRKRHPRPTAPVSSIPGHFPATLSSLLPVRTYFPFPPEWILHQGVTTEQYSSRVISDRFNDQTTDEHI